MSKAAKRSRPIQTWRCGHCGRDLAQVIGGTVRFKGTLQLRPESAAVECPGCGWLCHWYTAAAVPMGGDVLNNVERRG